VVVFVDASIDDEEVVVRGVEELPTGPRTMTHHGDPASLLSMVPSVGAMPEMAYVVSIPAADLSLGFEPTDATKQAIAAAVEVVAELVTRGD
jgi:Ni,Fe-hydrogenase maturation factor